MCGIVGLWASQSLPSEETFESMVDAIRHRGPDSHGSWRDESAGVTLGSTRLAVRDLSPAGRQPMLSRDGRFVLVYNGEIYNHCELRSRLSRAGYASWTGESDTETLLREIESTANVASAAKSAEGMFAFAVWDRRDRVLQLAVDRFGEKPLYYGYVGRDLVFASETGPIQRLPSFTGEIDRESLTYLFSQNAIPAPHCVYKGLRKLEAGYVVSFSAADVQSRHFPVPVQYWDAMKEIEAAVAHRTGERPSPATDAAAIDELESVLQQAVSRQMASDVPLGAFLSGGVDSSTIVALMQAEVAKTKRPPVKTFTIGFDSPSYDEASHARVVARHIGTEHHELQVTARHALDVIPKLQSIYDEPFADSSQIPTYLISVLARKHVTVALSGDGADELFGGYNRHLFGARMYPVINRFPAWIRNVAAAGVCAFSPKDWDRMAKAAAPVLPRSLRHAQPGYKLHVAARVLAEQDREQIYRRLVTHWDGAEVVLGASTGQRPLGGSKPPAGLKFSEEMMAMDIVGYLAADILQKVDRAAMSVSLETRMPYLDPHVFELAWRLPFHMKIRNGIGKWVLRQVLYRHMPAAIIDRPKMGFSVPLDAWLRGPLRDWADALLDESRLKSEGYLAPDLIRQRWKEHLSGERDWQFHLWDVLMFQAWLETSR